VAKTQLCEKCRQTAVPLARLCRRHLAMFRQQVEERWSGRAPCLACSTDYAGPCLTPYALAERRERGDGKT